MGFRKHPIPEPAAAGGSTAAVTASWTNGSAIGARLGGIVLTVAILCGPIAVAGLAYSAFTAAPPVAQQKVTPGFTQAQQDAGAYATAYVAAWLGATNQDSEALAQFTSVQSASFPTTPHQYTGLGVASISAASEGIVKVVVVASVAPTADASGVWPRRYFTVTVDATKDPKLSVLGLPAPTNGPTTGSGSVAVEYPTSVPTNNPAGQTVRSFLQAYLTGQGDITVVLSPGTTIKPIIPVPYHGVQLDSILASNDIPTNPSDGATARVMVQTDLTGATATDKTTATYLLRLRARAGRWEVASFDTYPVLSH